MWTLLGIFKYDNKSHSDIFFLHFLSFSSISRSLHIRFVYSILFCLSFTHSSNNFFSFSLSKFLLSPHFYLWHFVITNNLFHKTLDQPQILYSFSCVLCFYCFFFIWWTVVGTIGGLGMYA